MKMSKKTIIAMMLSLILAISNITSADASMVNETKTFTVTEKGVTYKIHMNHNSARDVYDFKVVATDSKDYVEISLDKHYENMEVTQYTYESESIFGKKYEEDEKEYDLSNHDYENNPFFETQKISYNSKTTEKWDDKYWYRYGSKKKKSYLEIGCKAKYLIRTDNLSDKKEAKCTKYTDSIKKCNSNYNKAMACAGGSGIMFGGIVALVAANVTFPPSVIITIVVSAVGGGGSVIACVKSCIDSYDYYCDVKDYYVVIRTYGKKE